MESKGRNSDSDRLHAGSHAELVLRRLKPGSGKVRHFPNQFLHKIDDFWFEMSPIGKFGILDFGYPEIRHWKNVVMFTKRFVINVAFMLELIG